MLDRRQLILVAPALLWPTSSFAASRRSSAIVTAKALPFINELRKKAGRDVLIIDPLNERAALDWSKEMALQGKLSHRNFKQRMRQARIQGPAAENVAYGQADAQSAINGWNGSRGHRRNMLGIYNRVGMAVARNSNSGNRPYWTMILSV